MRHALFPLHHGILTTLQTALQQYEYRGPTVRYGSVGSDRRNDIIL